jgi:hypothetical protein
MADSSDEDAARAQAHAPNTHRSPQPTSKHSTDPSELADDDEASASLQVPISFERRSTDPDAALEASSPRVRRDARMSGETTLLSAPAPADPREMEIDDRLDAHNRRLADLEERVETLASAVSRLEKPQSPRRPGWLVWVLFLLALALLWQLQQWLR